MSETTILTAPPALLPLFAKAVITGPTRRLRGVLKDRHVCVGDQEIDLDHLARYQRVCGFAVLDVLPPTYLHLLAFPLSVVRMTEPDFPFPLLGLVHLENHILQARPVRVDELVGVQVWADNLGPHPAGQLIDLVSEVTVGDDIVWSETSTYLRRGKGEKSTDGVEPMKVAAVPLEGQVATWRVPGNIGRRYADVSGDRNPIHLTDLTAKAFGFPKAIAHGMWLKAHAIAQFEPRLPDNCTIDVAFKTPVLLPSSPQFISAADGGGWKFELRNAKSGKPHLIGSITAS